MIKPSPLRDDKTVDDKIVIKRMIKPSPYIHRIPIIVIGIANVEKLWKSLIICYIDTPPVIMTLPHLLPEQTPNVL